MAYVSLTNLSNLIQEKLQKLNSGKLSAAELDELKDLTTELNERLIVLQYKAHESQLLKTANSILHEEVKQINAQNTYKTIEQPIKLNFGSTTTVTETKTPVVEQVTLPLEVEEIKKVEIPEPKIQETIQQKVEVPATNVTSGKMTLVERMQKTKVDDLNTIIGLNQKFLFMNFLFEGDNNTYNDAIDKLNKMPTVADARHYIRELAYIYTWDYENENVVLFTEFVERRYI